jgi:hypothetical protein
MAKKLARIMSLMDLRQRANLEIRYQRLAITAARNLGGLIPENRPIFEQYSLALTILNNNADLTDEKGVVKEINFVRNLVK